MQYHFELDGKLSVNPGSCGLPLDGIDGAPYSIIDIADNNVMVEEHRVKYDLDKAISDILSNHMYLPAKVWYDIIVLELNNKTEHVSFFLEYVRNYAESIDDSTRPYSKSTWKNAYEKWNFENTY